MKIKKAFLIFASLCVLILFSEMRPNYGKASTETVLVGCTPGDPLIKSVLNIFYKTNVDFIRWNLTLKSTVTGFNTFILNLNYGESKPNTLGFKEGGEKLYLEGTYDVSTITEGNLKRTIYQLKCNNSKINIISFVKLNENLYHLLSPGKKLLVGNGEWSYTLSRKTPVDSNVLPQLTIPSVLLMDTITQIVYEGRTPCQDPGCSKIKWRLTLNRDPATLLPTTYVLLRISDKQSEVQGNWSITKGSPSNSEAVIYRLDPENPEKTIALFAADRNVIFFLDKTSQLIIGNGDFSYTLNKKYREAGSAPTKELSFNKLEVKKIK